MSNSKQFPVQVTISAVDNITYKVMEINEKLKRVTEPLNKLKTAFGNLGSEMGLGKLGAAASAVGNNFKSFMQEATKSVAVMGGLMFATFRLIDGTAKYSAAIIDMSERLGISTTKVQEWQYAAEQAGVAGSEVEGIFTKFTKTIGEATKGGEGAQLFRAMDIAIKDSSGNIREIDAILPEVADKIKAIENPVLRNAIAMKLFGNQGVKFANVLRMGSDGLDAMAQKAHATGAIIEDGALSATNQFANNVAALTRQFNAIKTTAIAEFMPVVIDLLKQASDWMANNKEAVRQWATEFGKDLPGIIKGISGVLSGIGSAVKIITSAVSGLNAVFGTANVTVALIAATIFGKTIVAFASLTGSIIHLSTVGVPFLIKNLALLSPVFGFIKVAALGAWAAITAPVGLVVAAIAAVAGAAYLIYKYWEPIKGFFSGLWSSIKDYAAGALDWIMGKLSGIANFFKGIFGSDNKNISVTGSMGASGSAVGALDVGRSYSPASQSSRTENQITVNFENMPRGTRVRSEKAEAPIDLNLGYGMAGL